MKVRSFLPLQTSSVLTSASVVSRSRAESLTSVVEAVLPSPWPPPSSTDELVSCPELVSSTSVEIVLPSVVDGEICLTS